MDQGTGTARTIGQVVAWLVFPLVPVVLETAYEAVANLNLFSRSEYGPDPRDWDTVTWALMLGPLLGFGFLAGATIGLPAASVRRGFRGWFGRPIVWVAVGPWIGAL